MQQVIVLVPVLRRPENVEPLLASFESSDTPGRLLFVVNENDLAELEALKRAGADYLVVPPDRITWPHKINDGFAATEEPWILCAADDVVFHRGWFQATEELREAGFGVIGTQDLGNARVIAGEHTTHPLIKRLYVDVLGTVDEPGQPLHEGYRHWCVDDELVMTAKARGAWAFCAESVVEHLHPYWGKSDWDEIYELGSSEAKEDRQRFLKRLPMIERG